MNKYLLIIACLLIIVSCKKDEISILKKGRWKLEWGSVKGEINFKGGGRGVFYPEGSSDKVPFNYNITGSDASFQWESPSGGNTRHVFTVVISNETSQVWEEDSQFYKSTFILTK
jgi:hypothetical protein